MSQWFKMDPHAWNEGTNSLTLEQEAAYLRICNAMYIAGGPIENNQFVVAGLLRCNDRKAKRIVKELSDAGKITLENGQIINRRALDEISDRNRIATERKSAGSRGGTESGKSLAKSLKNNKSDEANASPLNEPDKIREREELEDNSPPKENTLDDDPADAGSPSAQHAFEATTIRLTKSDYEKWRKAYPLLSLDAELLALDQWAGDQKDEGKNWFMAVSSALAKKQREAHERMLTRRQAAREPPRSYQDTRI